MGVEAFGLSLQFSVPNARAKLEVVLLEYPDICLHDFDINTRTTLGELNDGVHIIDFQLREIEGSCILFMRFSLCSFSTIDAIFIDIARTLLSSYDANINLMTSALNQKNTYLPGDSSWLLAAIPDEIDTMRSYWRNLFGNRQGAVRVDESFSFVGAVKGRKRK